MGPDTAVAVSDSSDLRSVARAAQARFENRRLYQLPRTLDSHGGPCDEHVGRFCTWYSEGEWFPVPERREIVDLRAELLVTLDSIQDLLPGDGWVLGQRVWYRSEGGDWSGALEASRECPSVEAWWCAALQGFVLHGMGRYSRSLASFERSLTLMAPDDAFEWRVPLRAVDDAARDRLDDLRDVPPDSAADVLRKLWAFADPLFLVEGNDRESAHYARWTVSEIRRNARNPFHIRWGKDSEELTVRHGWEIGWERAPAVGTATADNVIGHKHPEGRDYMPPGDALTVLETMTDEDLQADKRRPRSLYAPGYAPVLLPMESQVAVFPRSQGVVVVATHYLPEDTTYHAGHRHDLPWMEAGEQGNMPDRAGLFLLSEDGRRMTLARSEDASEGALMLEADPGSYLLSAEAWSPRLRRAGRLRRGLALAPATEDVAALSDLLMLRTTSVVPETLTEALPLALPKASIRPGQAFAIGWEVGGLGFGPETLSFEVSVARTDRGVFRRIGEFFRLAERPRPLALSWQEPGPAEPTHHFRYLNLDLPNLEPGEYEIRLVLRTSGRTDVGSTRSFSVEGRE